MKIDFIDEPELQFGTGAHVDVRFGLMNYFPLDRGTDDAPTNIRLGVIGTAETIEGVLTWLNRCAEGISAKESKQPNLFPRFPGFGSESAFGCSYSCQAKHQRTLTTSDIERICLAPSPAAVVMTAVECFTAETSYLANLKAVDVVLCALPSRLLSAMEPDEPAEGEDDDPSAKDEEQSQDQKPLDFRDLLKAKVMSTGMPIQVVLPSTYGGKAAKLTRRGKVRILQDEATRAWNFFTALYYKAGGIPWRIVRDPEAYTSCFVGISFFRSVDERSMWTSVAQVFDERGDGVILQGPQAIISKEDKQPCLSTDASRAVLQDALKLFRDTHKTAPARIVLHKSSRFTHDEIAGFRGALAAEKIEISDFLSISKAGTRLFRTGQYPPLRGSFLALDQKHHVLYTRGGVDFFETYTGLYVPRGLLFRCERIEQTPRQLATEILSLTKMNWNSTQFDHRDPITLKAARDVGAVLKHLKPGDKVFPRYSFYM